MDLYSSKTPRDLITYDGDVCILCHGLVPRPGVQYVPDDGSLCECDILSDIAQHNPPNPILVLLRDAGWHPSYAVHDRAGWVLSAIEMTPEELRDLGATDAHMAHARAVLERIISFAGKDAAWAVQ